MQTVLNRADSIIDGVDGVNGLLDQTQTILDVDVNVTDISDDLSVSRSHALHSMTRGQHSQCTAAALLTRSRLRNLRRPSQSLYGRQFMRLCT